MIPLKIQSIVRNRKPLNLRILKHLDKEELILCILNREVNLFNEIEEKQKFKEIRYNEIIRDQQKQIHDLEKKIKLHSNYSELVSELEKAESEVLRLKKLCNEKFIVFT